MGYEYGGVGFNATRYELVDRPDIGFPKVSTSDRETIEG